MTSRSRAVPAEAGFTLLEMTVVIAVMGLIILLIVNNGPPTSHFLEEKAAAQHIAEVMRDSRGRAIAQGQPVPFILPPVPAWLTVSVQSPDGGIVFEPDGSATGGRVILASVGRRIAVSADWLTGKVQINAD